MGRGRVDACYTIEELFNAMNRMWRGYCCFEDCGNDIEAVEGLELHRDYSNTARKLVPH
jgi:hypothetical protein